MTKKERVAIYVRMPQASVERVRKAAKKEGRTLSSYVRWVLEQALKEVEK